MFKDLFGNFLDWKSEKLGKHIVFANIGHVALQQKTLCLFQDYAIKNNIVLPKKVAIVTFEVGKGVYQRFINVENQINDTRLRTPSNTYADFIKWSFLISNKIPESFFDQYDMVLWDLPDLNFVHDNSEPMKVFFNMFSSMIIVSNGQALTTNSDQVNQIKNFFINHGFKLPQLLRTPDEDKKAERKTSLRFWI